VRRLLVPLIAACAALAAAVPAQAFDQAALERSLAAQMRRISVFSGAYVRDLDTGRVLFAQRHKVARPPASVEKLYTTATALLRFGPDATLRTQVLGVGGLDIRGVWRGDLYLRGGGDPTLGDAQLAALARGLADHGVRRVVGSVFGDESLFDSFRGSSRTGFAFDRAMGGVLSAVAVGRGFSRDGSPASEAARRLVRALRAEGIRVTGRASRGIAPAGALELAAIASPPMRELIRLTNVPSDNFYAETLLKDLGAGFGGAGTTTAGRAVVNATIRAEGIKARISDGSGLSRANRSTPKQVVRLLMFVHRQPLGPIFEGSLAVAGRTGTVSRRMRGTAAQDRCHTKTGTIRGVSNLAGFCLTEGGATVGFAFLTTNTSLLRAHAVQDRMAAAVARLDGVS
jgi:serine-type D-Ala-D-Ala carboxypeptidase/endopeptidase (penicillin-binding protein 4)